MSEHVIGQGENGLDEYESYKEIASTVGPDRHKSIGVHVSCNESEVLFIVRVSIKNRTLEIKEQSFARAVNEYNHGFQRMKQ